MTFINNLPTTQAKEFWDLLSPEKSLLPERRSDQFLYRGVRDSTWKLVPSLWRDENQAKISAYARASGPLKADDTVWFEMETLRSLIQYSDNIGLPIPNDSTELRESLDQNKVASHASQVVRVPNLWPSKSLYPLLALAQHYELPTRLLDWSTRSYVAAYFAASDAVSFYSKDKTLDKSEISDNGKMADIAEKHLAVWAYNTSQQYQLERAEVIQVPTSCNNNLRVQSGRFVMVRDTTSFRSSEICKENIQLDKYVESKKVKNALWKITLPISEAPALLDLCRLYNISGSTMFPDYYGAVRQIQDDIAVMAFIKKYNLAF